MTTHTNTNTDGLFTTADEAMAHAERILAYTHADFGPAGRSSAGPIDEHGTHRSTQKDGTRVVEVPFFTGERDEVGIDVDQFSWVVVRSDGTNEIID